MKAEHFLQYFRPEMSEYCPVIIWADGNVFDSSAGHMQMLRALTKKEILDCIPKDVSPMLYLVGIHNCVIVDYETQIYMDELTPEQEHALNVLQDAGLISNHRVRMTHEAIKL